MQARTMLEQLHEAVSPLHDDAALWQRIERTRYRIRNRLGMAQFSNARRGL
jgi:hypothetical protein